MWTVALFTIIIASQPQSAPIIETPTPSVITDYTAQCSTDDWYMDPVCLNFHENGAE